VAQQNQEINRTKINLTDTILVKSYSPEVNSVEQILDDIRGKEFNNELFETIDQAMDNAEIGIKRLANDKHYLTSLTSRNHLMYILEH